MKAYLIITVVYLDASSNDGVRVRLLLRHFDAGSAASLSDFEAELNSGRPGGSRLSEASADIANLPVC